MKLCVIIICLLLLLQTVDLIKHYCPDGQKQLYNIYNKHSKLCDGIENCDDGSDESHCTDFNTVTPTEKYSGCWEYTKRGYNNQGKYVYENLKITPCSQCICPVKHAVCNNFDSDGYCNKCITSPQVLGDSTKDCLYGIDESKDTLAIKNHINNVNWRYYVFNGTWKCTSTRRPGIIKSCHEMDWKYRTPTLVAFPYGKEKCSVGLDVNFWHCTEKKSCIRDKFPCEMANKTICQPGFTFIKELNICTPDCKSHERHCQKHDNSTICSNKKSPCIYGTQCQSPMKFCEAENLCGNFCNEKQERNLIANDKLVAPQHANCPNEEYGCLTNNGTVCINVDQPCDGVCLGGRDYCKAVDKCLIKDEVFQQSCSQQPGCYLGFVVAFFIIAALLVGQSGALFWIYWKKLRPPMTAATVVKSVDNHRPSNTPMQVMDNNRPNMDPHIVSSVAHNNVYYDGHQHPQEDRSKSWAVTNNPYYINHLKK